MRKSRIESLMQQTGACWAVRPDKYRCTKPACLCNLADRQVYHIHPDADYPHQRLIKSFSSLDDLAEYLEVLRAMDMCANELERIALMEDYRSGRREIDDCH